MLPRIYYEYIHAVSRPPACAHAVTYAGTRAQTHPHARTHGLDRTHACSHAHAWTHAHARMSAWIHALARTHEPTHTHACTHAHAITQIKKNSKSTRPLYLLNKICFLIRSTGFLQHRLNILFLGFFLTLKYKDDEKIEGCSNRKKPFMKLSNSIRKHPFGLILQYNSAEVFL